MVDSSRTRRRVVAAPARKVELQSIRVLFERDPDADASYLQQDGFAERREDYDEGRFFFVSARAEADVVVDGVKQLLRSSGLNAIESDSEEEYIEAIAVEEWASLRGVLKTVGVPTSDLPLECDRAWIEWRI
jgi:hypothetical protein